MSSIVHRGAAEPAHRSRPSGRRPSGHLSRPRRPHLRLPSTGRASRSSENGAGPVFEPRPGRVRSRRAPACAIPTRRRRRRRTRSVCGAPPPARRPPRSWDRLVHLHAGRLTAVARRSLSRCGLSTRTEDVEDLVQDVWCRLVERWGTRPGRGVRADGGLFAYLATAVRNAAVDRARAAAAAKRGQRCPGDPGRVDLLAAAGPSPEERLLERDGRRLFRARCRPYTSRSRRRRDVRVAELALLDGWTSRQIAEALRHRLAPSSIDSLVHRVRRGLAAEGLSLPSRR